MKQKAVVVKPIMGPDPSLDLSQLQLLLDDGWQVIQTEQSVNASILVIVEKEEQ
jgi:hypothetical protein